MAKKKGKGFAHDSETAFASTINQQTGRVNKPILVHADPRGVKRVSAADYSSPSGLSAADSRRVKKEQKALDRAAHLSGQDSDGEEWHNHLRASGQSQVYELPVQHSLVLKAVCATA